MDTECPICSATVVVPEDAVTGELLSCMECATELEVKSLNPASLVEAPTEEEDWGE